MKGGNIMSSELAPPKVTDMLCENLVNTKYENLSEWNIECFKDRLLDITGCIFGGAIVEDNQVLVDLAKRWGGTEEAPVFLKGFRAPVNNAVLINCVVARSNDYGNMFMHVLGDRIASHLGETLIPLGLTLADMYGTSGKDFITNNVAAEDLTGRILYTFVNRWPFDMLLVSTAAAAMASRYYGLNAERTKAALSFAATNSTDPANSYYDYSQEFKYHNGESARCGIMSAELAKGGWRGLVDPYFGHWGLAVRDTGGELPPNYEKAIQDLGKIYYTEESFKIFPGGIPNTPATVAAQKVRARFIDRGYKVSDIKKVEVERSENTGYNYYAAPFAHVDQLNALFCYQFQVCCALYYGTVKVEYVQTKAIQNNPELVEMVQNSTMGVYKFAEGEEPVRGMRVRVTMKDGTVFEHTEPATAMHKYPTREFIISKFKDQFNAFGKLPASTADKIIELALNIEKVSDMREYTSLLQI